jgi:DNA-binding transcriptional regulator YhcF (GntR family)
VQIAGDLRQAILGGTYPPGSKLPTKDQLMARYRERFGTAAVGTINAALRELTRQQLIESRRGVGIFVASPLPDLDAPSESEQLRALVENLADQVAELTGRLEEAGVLPPPEGKRGDAGGRVQAIEERLEALSGQESAEVQELRRQVAVLHTHVIDLYARSGFPYPRDEAEPGKQGNARASRPA